MQIWEQPRRLNGYAKLLLYFADDGLLGCLSEFYFATRQLPFFMEPRNPWRSPHRQQYLMATRSHDAGGYNCHAFAQLFFFHAPLNRCCDRIRPRRYWSELQTP